MRIDMASATLGAESLDGNQISSHSPIATSRDPPSQSGCEPVRGATDASPNLSLGYDFADGGDHFEDVNDSAIVTSKIFTQAPALVDDSLLEGSSVAFDGNHLPLLSDQTGIPDEGTVDISQESNHRLPKYQSNIVLSLPSPQSPQSTSSTTFVPASVPNAVSAPVTSPTVEAVNAMIFDKVSTATAHRRRTMATTSALTDYEADLTSKDRLKQKDAIRRILVGIVKDDWVWAWPQEDIPATPVVERNEGDVSENEWKERDEWTDNASEGAEFNDPYGEFSSVIKEEEKGKNEAGLSIGDHTDPFRFSSPDNTGDSLQNTADARKLRRHKRLQEEHRTNEGLRCFTARRNAWTCARHVRRPRPKVVQNGNSSHSVPDPEAIDDSLDLTTEIPIAPPILPESTPMRKGINEKAYLTIYDKIITQSQTPFCPINLSVVVRSCVEGWQRDGEWPPKTGDAPKKVAATTGRSLPWPLILGDSGVARAKSAGSARERNVIRRGFQKVFGVVQGGKTVVKEIKEGESSKGNSSKGSTNNEKDGEGA